MADEKDDKKTVKQPISQVDPTQFGTASRDAARDPLLGREDLIAGYKLVQKLGEGGMGVVYKGVQLSLNRDVAIKIMKVFGNDSDTGFQARFKREALAAAKLNHPHIVSIYDHGSAHGTIYMVLEFIKGKDCGEILQESGPYAEAAAFDLIRDVVLGLSHAAEEGVIHRDIKPANIMVAYRGMGDAQRREGGVAKLTDFGIAALHRKAKEPGMTELTQQGTVIGTPGYMSPEQSMGKEVDFRSDIYSLGCTLYYLLTGKPPYFGQTAIEVFHNKMTQQIPNPRDLREGVGQGAVDVIARMMARDADDRYQSYEDLLNDIDAVLAGRVPERDPIPNQSQSIAPSIGMPMGDETAMAATALAGTAAAPAATIAQKRAPGAQDTTKSKRLLPLLGVIGLVLAGAGLFFVLSGKDGDDSGGGGAKSGETTTPVSMAAFLDDVEKEADDAFVLNIEQRGATFRAMVGEVASVEERADAERRFKKRMTNAVRETDRARRDEIQKLQKEARWPELVDRLDRAARVYEAAGSTPFSTVRKLMESRDTIRDQGAAERAAWKKIEVTKDPLEKRGLVEAFIRNYDFSPEINNAKSLLRKLPAPRDLLDRCEGLVADIGNLDLGEFLKDGTKLESEAKAAFEQLDTKEKRRLRTELATVMKDRREAFAAQLVLELDRVWKAGDYAKLGRRLPEVTDEMKRGLRLRRPEDRVEKYARIVKDAVDRGLGDKERSIVRRVGASKDEAEVAKLLEGFADTYWFSPDLDAMQARFERARAAVPALVIKTPGGEGDLLIDGEAMGRTPWSGALARGSHRIEVRRAGFYPIQIRHQHREASTLELPLFPRPAERRRPVAQRRLPLLVMAGHPLATRRPATWGPAVGGSMTEVPEDAALNIISGQAARGWVTSSLPLDQYLNFPSIRGGKGWRVILNVRRTAGEAEVRLKDGGNTVVVRLTSEGLFVGREDELHRCPDVAAPAAGRSQPLALEWHGDVLVIRPSTANAEERIVGSVPLDRLDAKRVEMTIAVREGEARFGDMQVQKMN